MDQQTANQIITQLAKDYDNIAEHFSHTRMNQWYEVSYLIEQYIEPGQLILDMGCGNGRVADLVDEIKARYIGIDVSEKLVNVAQQLRPQHKFYTGNMLKTEFEDNTFDHILMIASFHHLPGKEMRLVALEETKRIVKPRGYIIMTNWNLHRLKFASLRYKFLWKKIIGQNKMDINDVLVPWRSQKRELLAERYYHAFQPPEMISLARQADLKIADQYYEINGLHVPRYKANNLVTIFVKQ